MTTKTSTIIFWITTTIIFLMEGVMPALTSQTKLAKDGIAQLGYPEYFGTMLAVFKVGGALALMIPQVPNRVKEWAYAGFAIDFICAFVSTGVVKGFTGLAFFPLVFLVILIVSYVQYDKLRKPFGGGLVDRP
jgi:hypothetical protein